MCKCIYVQYMYSICTVYVQYMYSICTVYVQYMYSICKHYNVHVGTIPDMSRTLVASHQENHDMEA